MSLRKQTPSDFLKQIIGRPVVVKLNSGVDYRGVLACLDGYMNIAIEQTEEYVNGQLKNKYGDAFLRGNNGKMIQFIFMFHSTSQGFGDTYGTACPNLHTVNFGSSRFEAVVNVRNA
uniref:U6 snRNA-associated Sm-like protein LSm6 n=1 Tax=Seriola lalandi dorsalis TaxID=1841481 RepID=A0A3B4WKR0_SERLL